MPRRPKTTASSTFFWFLTPNRTQGDGHVLLVLRLVAMHRLVGGLEHARLSRLQHRSLGLVLLGLRLVEEVVRDDVGHREDAEGLRRAVGVLSGSLVVGAGRFDGAASACLLYTSPSPRDRTRSRMPSSA